MLTVPPSGRMCVDEVGSSVESPWTLGQQHQWAEWPLTVTKLANSANPPLLDRSAFNRSMTPVESRLFLPCHPMASAWLPQLETQQRHSRQEGRGSWSHVIPQISDATPLPPSPSRTSVQAPWPRLNHVARTGAVELGWWWLVTFGTTSPLRIETLLAKRGERKWVFPQWKKCPPVWGRWLWTLNEEGQI